MYRTFGAPAGALGGSNGDQSGSESRMSTLMVPSNGLAMSSSSPSRDACDHRDGPSLSLASRSSIARRDAKPSTEPAPTRGEQASPGQGERSRRCPWIRDTGQESVPATVSRDSARTCSASHMKRGEDRRCGRFTADALWCSASDRRALSSHADYLEADRALSQWGRGPIGREERALPAGLEVARRC